MRASYVAEVTDVPGLPAVVAVSSTGVSLRASEDFVAPMKHFTGAATGKRAADAASSPQIFVTVYFDVTGDWTDSKTRRECRVLPRWTSRPTPMWSPGHEGPPW
jgi:hypothetical protein